MRAKPPAVGGFSRFWREGFAATPTEVMGMASTLTNYGSPVTIQVLSPTPTGAGGLAIQADLILLTDAVNAHAALIAAKADASALAAHTSDTNNPHAVTATQVGAYSTAQTDSLLAVKADSTAVGVALAQKANVSDLGSVASQDYDSINITGGSISGTIIADLGRYKVQVTFTPADGYPYDAWWLLSALPRYTSGG